MHAIDPPVPSPPPRPDDGTLVSLGVDRKVRRRRIDVALLPFALDDAAPLDWAAEGYGDAADGGGTCTATDGGVGGVESADERGSDGPDCPSPVPWARICLARYWGAAALSG